MLEVLNPALEIDAKLDFIYLRMLLWYNDAKDVEEVKKIENLIEEKLGVNLMGAFAETDTQLAEETGTEKGSENGTSQRNIEIAIKMLYANADEHFIKQITGLSIPEIQKLKKSLKN